MIFSIRDFQLQKHKRKCWQHCHECKKELIKENTDFVHMVITLKSECRFKCQECQEKKN